MREKMVPLPVSWALAGTLFFEACCHNAARHDLATFAFQF
jgi:hypothetical protein